MSFTANINRKIHANIFPALKIRGLDRVVDLSFPDTVPGAWEDFSIDFCCLIAQPLWIVEMQVSASGANIAWQTINGTTTVTFCAQWPSSSVGLQSVTVSVLLSDGTTQTLTASINIAGAASLIQTYPQQFSPNAFLLSPSIFVQDSTLAQPLVMG